jgi:hypothetical protein
MSKQLTTYSGMDLNFALAHPLIGTIQASGVAAKGIKSVSIRMAVDQSNIQVGMDGAVVPSVIPGDQGEIEIQVWQTSTLHQDLMAWYNAVKSARDAGDVQQWFSATLLVASIVDGSSHTCTGVAPAKIPDKPYQEQAQPVSWQLRACNITNE